jgi:hypothetical protein
MNGNTYEFRHLSFQKFLAAKELITDGSSKRRQEIVLYRFSARLLSKVTMPEIFPLADQSGATALP